MIKQKTKDRIKTSKYKFSTQNQKFLGDNLENEKNAKKFKFLAHTADVKFQAFGKNLEEQFTNAGLALKETIAEGVEVQPSIKKKIKVRGDDLKGLLYSFLEEFLYLLDAEDFLLGDIEKIKIDEKKFELDADVVGDNASNYKFVNDVKAITYNEMIVDKKFVQVVLDV